MEAPNDLAYLGRVVPQYAVHHNDLLALSKPSILTSKPTGSLSRAGRQVEPREHTDDGSQASLEGEQPPPSLPARDVAHVEDAKGQERRHDEGGVRRAVEVAHAHRHLGVLVEVAEVEDRVWDESALDEAEQGAGGVKGFLAGDEALADADDAPGDHLDGDPDVGPKLFRDHL